ncbi:uncharacterized protein K460DRAFT_396587 [Cucurbitaria berberidis CBS 394.84]|uniref:Uncharacterized protein n=1 Tax=Cucurbitaria berberidis CBS 394.84 TaxID=1168544 RepID=A0A9P4GCA1_9PLEO|nr:uncharacterized protein K460DRAFT_396587 [Cucurbitaria berberidis CBS 394.84]KAF1843228.1 hypothetical protein K460DRAFT_396587 [Cucurbitaria berberidis CBS 394.84]
MANFLQFVLLSCIAFFSFACCEDVKLPQGNKIAIDILQKLQSAHEVAVNQKAQEELFLSLPLVAPNQTDSVTVANTTATVSTPPKIRHRERTAEAASSANYDKRQVTSCSTRLTYEGQDPCEGKEKLPNFVPCDQPCKYTLDWFVANAVARPEIDECLFYTSGLSERAKAYAREHNAVSRHKLTTIWFIWADKQFTWNKNVDNPMRCIIQDDVYPGRRNQIRYTYFQMMSDSMAFMCGGKVAVMDRNIRRGRTGKVKQAGIWQQKEFPRLKMDADHKWKDGNGKNRVATRIDAIGENLLSVPDTLIWWKSWWYRGGPDWPNEFTKPFKRRSVDGDVNVTDHAVLEEARSLHKRDFDTSVFDEGGRLAIDW